MNDHQRKSDRSDPSSIPKVVAGRLSLYLRELQRLVRQGRQTINSHEMGQLLGLTDAQVRKDLAHVGHFGLPGVGYRCEELVDVVRRILGTHQMWNVGLVGVGNLGRALLGYKGFLQQGFRLIAAFDVSPEVVGSSIEGVPVHALDGLPEVVHRETIRLGMIAVPAGAAQSVADRLVMAGVEGIVNFAPVTITVPPEVSLVGVDLAIELEQVSFSVVNRMDSR